MPKTQFHSGSPTEPATFVTPEFLNAINSPDFEGKDEDGSFKLPYATDSEAAEGLALDKIMSPAAARAFMAAIKANASTPYSDNERYATPFYTYEMLLSNLVNVGQMASYTRDLGTIGANERMELANEYGTDFVIAIVEVQYNNAWGMTGAASDAAGGWFAQAHQHGLTGDKIIVSTGTGGVLALPQYAGHPHQNTEPQVSLPARLRVVSVAKGDPIYTAFALYDYQMIGDFSIDSCFYADSIKKYIALCLDKGWIAYTDDPAASSPWSVSRKDGIKELTHGAGVFIANMGAHLEYSADLISWQPCEIAGSINDRNITAIGYHEESGLFAAWDSNYDAYLTSPDGITFTVQALPVVTSHPDRILSAGELLFMFNTADNSIYASRDGLEFAALAVELDNIYDVAFGNSVYLICGSRADGACVAISTDGGATYTVQDSINIPYAATPDIVCAFGKGMFVIADYVNTKYYKSADGVTWGGHTYA